MDFSIDYVIDSLKNERKVFTSEADFQLALARKIEKLYTSNVKVRLEFCPEFKPDMHIDILVIWTSDNGNKKWIPIELKYKTKDLEYQDDGCVYNLKNHSANDWGCYDYMKDIERIELIKHSLGDGFKCGFAIFLTNDDLYIKGTKSDCSYYNFQINEGRCINNLELVWNKKLKNYAGREKSIKLSGSYKFRWEEYSKIDKTTFKILVSKI